MANEQQSQTPKQQEANPVAKVAAWVQSQQKQDKLALPKDYHAWNALSAAYNALQETKDMKGNYALDVCTRSSIERALRYMVIQGLNVDKDQGFFIVYSNQLAFQRSYFGDIKVAQDVDARIHDVIAEPVFDKDEFTWTIERGKRVVEYHKPGGLNDRGKLYGAYCILLDAYGNTLKTEIMSRDEIFNAWKKSWAKPFDDNGNLKPNSNHYQQPGEMAKRTVIRRCLKPIINSSSDENLLRAVDSTEETAAAVEAEQEENQAKQTLDVTPKPNESLEAEGETQAYPSPGTESDGVSSPADDHPDAHDEGPGTTGPSGESPPDEGLDGPFPEQGPEPEPEDEPIHDAEKSAGEPKKGSEDEPPEEPPF